MGCTLCNQLLTDWERIISKLHCQSAASTAYKALIDHRMACEIHKETHPATVPLTQATTRMIITSGFDFTRDFSIQSPGSTIKES